jgi:hypothetical protein
MIFIRVLTIFLSLLSATVIATQEDKELQSNFDTSMERQTKIAEETRKNIEESKKALADIEEYIRLKSSQTANKCTKESAYFCLRNGKSLLEQGKEINAFEQFIQGCQYRIGESCYLAGELLEKATYNQLVTSAEFARRFLGSTKDHYSPGQLFRTSCKLSHERACKVVANKYGTITLPASMSDITLHSSMYDIGTLESNGEMYDVDNIIDGYHGRNLKRGSKTELLSPPLQVGFYFSDDQKNVYIVGVNSRHNELMIFTVTENDVQVIGKYLGNTLKTTESDLEALRNESPLFNFVYPNAGETSILPFTPYATFFKTISGSTTRSLHDFIDYYVE